MTVPVPVPVLVPPSDTVAGLLAALDANPDDRQLLLVIADAYDDADYGTGIGWRALVATDRCPEFSPDYEDCDWRRWVDGCTERWRLPVDWYDAVPATPFYNMFRVFPVTSAAYAEAAAAVLRLPQDRQEQLLRGIL